MYESHLALWKDLLAERRAGMINAKHQRELMRRLADAVVIVETLEHLYRAEKERNELLMEPWSRVAKTSPAPSPPSPERERLGTVSTEPRQS